MNSIYMDIFFHLGNLNQSISFGLWPKKQDKTKTKTKPCSSCSSHIHLHQCFSPPSPKLIARFQDPGLNINHILLSGSFTLHKFWKSKPEFLVRSTKQAPGAGARILHQFLLQLCRFYLILPAHSSVLSQGSHEGFTQFTILLINTFQGKFFHKRILMPQIYKVTLYKKKIHILNSTCCF